MISLIKLLKEAITPNPYSKMSGLVAKTPSALFGKGETPPMWNVVISASNNELANDTKRKELLRVIGKKLKAQALSSDMDFSILNPDKIKCHPKTSIDDVEVIQKRVNKPREEKPKTWKFESSSGGGIYEVRMTPNGLKCNCFGAIRSKQNCKHIKQVRTEL